MVPKNFSFLGVPKTFARTARATSAGTPSAPSVATMRS